MLGLKGGSSKPQHDPAKTKAAAEKTIHAVGDLSENEERLEKKRELLEKKMEVELNRAKELSKQNKKPQALLALKKKKMFETQLEQTNNLILRLNEQKMMLENQRATVEVVQAMHGAAKVAKQTMQEMNIDHVDDLMANIQEQNDEMAQIQDALAQPAGLVDMDEADLEGELEALENEVNDEALLAPAPIPTTVKIGAEAEELPAAPKTGTTAEDELAQLEAELAA